MVSSFCIGRLVTSRNILIDELVNMQIAVPFRTSLGAKWDEVLTEVEWLVKTRVGTAAVPCSVYTTLSLRHALVWIATSQHQLTKEENERRALKDRLKN